MSDLSKVLASLEKINSRLDAIESKVGGGGGGGGGAAGAGGVPAVAGDANASVDAYDAIVTQHLAGFIGKSKKIDAEVGECAQLFVLAADTLRGTLLMAANAKKPQGGDLGDALKPVGTAMGEVSAFRDSRRGHKWFDHLSTLSEGVAALGWVGVEPTPGPFATQSRAGSEFYSNRLLKQYRGKDEEQVAWVAAINGFLKALEPFIKEHHRTGLTWAGQGSFKDFMPGGVTALDTPKNVSAAAAAAKKPAAAPAPKAGGAGGAPTAGLFAELSKGNVGAKGFGLKKVEKSQMTHKNTALRAGGVVKAATAAKTPVRRGVPSGTPKLALEGNKWVVEFQDGNKNIVLDKVELKHTVYIYGCFDCVVQVKGKVNQISIDSCKKTSVVCESVVSGIDAVNANSGQVQVTGKCANINIEKTSGFLIYLSKDCMHDVDIVTSKIDSVNVAVPDPKSEGDFREVSIAEQFKSKVSTTGGNVTISTEPVRHE